MAKDIRWCKHIVMLVLPCWLLLHIGNSIATHADLTAELTAAQNFNKKFFQPTIGFPHLISISNHNHPTVQCIIFAY